MVMIPTIIMLSLVGNTLVQFGLHSTVSGQRGIAIILKYYNFAVISNG